MSNIINDKLKAVQSQDYRLALEYKNEELKIKKKINDLQKTSCFSIKSSDIFHIIGLKSNTLVSSDKTKIINQIKRNLEQELVGQDIVVQEYVAFLNKIAILPKHLKTILLEGSSGIGKTLFVKTIVKSEERKLIIINPLSNFNHFISFIRKYPNAIILVENYDKLNEEMRNGFLNIINDEQIIDENENTVSFRHCFLFIKSSYPSVSMGFDSNRLSVNDLSIDFDLKLQFKPLTKQDIKTILERNKIVLQDNNLDDYCKHGLKSILKKTPV